MRPRRGPGQLGRYSRRMPIPLSVTRLNRRFTNRLMRHLAGHGPFVELEHVGRKTGTVRRIPLNAFLSADHTRVTCALTYGPRVDWYRNVTASGGCRMRTNQGVLTLGAPRTLEPVEGMSRMPALARVILPLARVSDFIEMPVVAVDTTGTTW